MCRVGDPANRHAVWRRPEVLVPARRGDTGSIAAAIGEARVCPRYPGRLDFNALEPAQQICIGFCFAQSGKHGSMPCAANDGYALKAFRLCCAYCLAHVRLALSFVLIL